MYYYVSVCFCGLILWRQTITGCTPRLPARLANVMCGSMEQWSNDIRTKVAVDRVAESWKQNKWRCGIWTWLTCSTYWCCTTYQNKDSRRIEKQGNSYRIKTVVRQTLAGWTNYCNHTTPTDGIHYEQNHLCWCFWCRFTRVSKRSHLYAEMGLKYSKGVPRLSLRGRRIFRSVEWQWGFECVLWLLGSLKHKILYIGVMSLVWVASGSYLNNGYLVELPKMDGNTSLRVKTYYDMHTERKGLNSACLCSRDESVGAFWWAIDQRWTFISNTSIIAAENV